MKTKNKYDDFFFKTEKKYVLIRNLKLLNIANKIIIESFLKSKKRYNTSKWHALFDRWMFGYSTFDEKTKKIIDDNIFKKLNPVNLINIFMLCLTDSITHQDEYLNIYINSFIQSGLIKNLTYNKNKNFFTLTTNNDEIIKFSNLIEDINQLKNNRGSCHSLVKFLLIDDNPNNLENLYGVTIITTNFFNKPQYHSFVVKDNYVYDFAHNINISFDDYKKLYNPKIIYKVTKNDLIKSIRHYNETDPDFSNSKGPDFLKCAMHKQMAMKKKTKK